jgi:DNA-binding IclR family transcriptional regulator
VLDCFSSPAAVLSLADLTAQTGIPKPTVHRLLNDLVEWRALERTHSGFRLGVRLFELGGLVHLNDQLREVALPYMSRLYEGTHEIVHLAVLDGIEVLYIAKLRGPNSPRAPSRVAGRMPLHCTAIGKALLAFSNRFVANQVLERRLARHTPYTITSPDLLVQQLVEIRKTRIAYEMEESAIALACVASPIVGRNGKAIAAISVSGRLRSIDPDRVGQTVKATATAISCRLAKLYPEVSYP